MNGHIFAVIIVAVLAITGFTTNENITATPGLTPILSLFPIFFVIIGLLVVARLVNPDSIFQGETESHPYTKADFGGEEPEPEKEPEPLTENCKNCGGPNVSRVTCQYCGQVLEK